MSTSNDLDIVCFANDWDGDPLSKKHIMRRLARRGARVLWVNSLGNRAPRLGDRSDAMRLLRKAGSFARSALAGPREVDERIWVVDPIAAPAYGSRLAARANGALVGAHVRGAARTLGLRAPIHYTFVPASAWVAGRIGERALVYHAADEYGAFQGANSQAIGALEDTLLRRADLYVACSAPLLASKSDRCRRAVLVRHGVEHEHFARALLPATQVPEPLRNLTPPVVGFIGLVADWVDVDLLSRVAEGLAGSGGGSVVIIGDVRGADPRALQKLAARGNVLFAGRRPYAELPGWCRGLAVATLPFAVNPLTIAANPLKLREYLAAGLPVVSTDLPEARALASLAPEHMVVAPNRDAFVRACLTRARASDAGPRPERSIAVAGESWDRKVAELHAALLQLPYRTAHDDDEEVRRAGA